MLCPLADVIAKCVTIGDSGLMLLPLFDYGRCYCHVADVIATGWITLILVLSCSTEPHPIYEADGIYLYFYLGMDCSP